MFEKSILSKKYLWTETVAVHSIVDAAGVIVGVGGADADAMNLIFSVVSLDKAHCFGV